MTENLKHPLDSFSQSPKRPSKISKTTDDQEVVVQEQSMRIQRYLVAIEYNGTRFSGSQQQSNCRTVVGVLEMNQRLGGFNQFIGQPVSIFCSSRTDAGVHALSNVCHVDIERISKRRPGEVLAPHEPAVVKRAVNHFLQKNEGDIMVVDVRNVPGDFHARYKAQERTYFYRLLSGPEPLSIFEKDRAWHVPEELDVLAMQEACKVLVGHHDFSSFRAAGCQAKSPIRTLDELNVSEVLSTPNFPNNTREETKQFSAGRCSLQPTNLRLTATLVSMGELIQDLAEKKTQMLCGNSASTCFPIPPGKTACGVLKSVGTGDLNIPDVERILNAKTVTAASPMAPACGLYLGHVKYDLP
ncbi:hypothetical protein M0R45_026182 [Rubus argutus]|uniref:tRNA pseudouridine synthase n=1 Tax=Rubus argutus TaxID=59490 RepID=A0AAW1X067_RUBAR